MRRRVVVWFRPEEEHLYLRLLSVARKTRKGRNWGISEYLKSLIRYHLFPENMPRELLFEFAYREIFGWRCRFCGGRGKVKYLFDEGDKLRVQIQCTNPEHGWDSTDLVWVRYPESPELREELKKWVQERTGKTIQPWPPRKTESVSSKYEFVEKT